MLYSKEEANTSPPKSCDEDKPFAAWWKTVHHNYHHHFHHLHFNGLKWNAAPEDKNEHCHRSKWFESCWGHQRVAQESQPKEENEVSSNQRCIFLGLLHKETNQDPDFLFDYSENYN
ncbi:hypothetical protein ACLKA7_008516 [Drosophila subpalustris]